MHSLHYTYVIGTRQPPYQEGMYATKMSFVTAAGAEYLHDHYGRTSVDLVNLNSSATIYHT